MAKAATLTVSRGWLAPNAYVWSPFVTKLEFRLRAAGVAYDVDGAGPRAAPKGKIPFISFAADDGSTKQVGDSALIFHALVESGQIPDLNAGLSAVQKVADAGLKAMLEDRMYFLWSPERWIDNYYIQRDRALSALPALLRPVIGYMVYRKVQTMLHGQGTGRFTPEELAAFKEEIWDDIDRLMLERRSQAGSKSEPFWALGGVEPTEADASIYGFIISGLVSKSAPATCKCIKGKAGLMDYTNRIHDRYFPDYEKWT